VASLAAATKGRPDMKNSPSHTPLTAAGTEARITALLRRLSLADKIGQLCQAHGTSEATAALVRQGAVGSVLNAIGPDARRLQELALRESPHGIPLIIGRDVIHGFRTVFPIPLAQAASFNPGLVRDAAAVAAREASAVGVSWTFAPMVDIARDPRWGRIAEGFGEDPVLASALGAAAVEGFQGPDPAAPDRIACCAKHYVGYGAAESGRDYNTTSIPEGLLRDVYLAPFHACVRAGAATLMSAFNDLNGIPASGNRHTIRAILKAEWGFKGFVVSDWASITEMIEHGYCADPREAALKGFRAGVDMEMVSTAYREHLAALIRERQIPRAWVDDAVRRILRIKFACGLFAAPHKSNGRAGVAACAGHLDAAREAARQCAVLLQNNGVLPLATRDGKLAVIGPMADAPSDQNGCWCFDQVAADSQTPLAALRARLGADRVLYARGTPDCRQADASGIAEAVAAARQADAVVLCIGEDAGMSGEAHCRAFLDLPGAQQALVDAVAAVGKPCVAVLFTGRPLVLRALVEKVQALLLVWHPGTMAGPAIADLLFGDAAPSGKLPVSFPLTLGQVPVYYARRNTGRPPRDDVSGPPLGTPLDPKDFRSVYMDADHRPLFSFGFGLSYTTFEYARLTLGPKAVAPGKTLKVAVDVTNTGRRAGTEVVQLYVRDLTASVTRPVRELKQFQRVTLAAGETRRVTFALHTDELAFHGEDLRRRLEPGAFRLWVGGSSVGGLQAEFAVKPARR
jgi:beta-glucosidase